MLQRLLTLVALVSLVEILFLLHRRWLHRVRLAGRRGNDVCVPQLIAGQLAFLLKALRQCLLLQSAPLRPGCRVIGLVADPVEELHHVDASLADNLGAGLHVALHLVDRIGHAADQHLVDLRCGLRQHAEHGGGTLAHAIDEASDLVVLLLTSRPILPELFLRHDVVHAAVVLFLELVQLVVGHRLRLCGSLGRQGNATLAGKRRGGQRRQRIKLLVGESLSRCRGCGKAVHQPGGDLRLSLPRFQLGELLVG